MNQRAFIFITLLLLSITNLLAAEKFDLVKYVNKYQGTNSRFELTHGYTYSTTALPFAMLTWAAQTGRNGGAWKYHYEREVKFSDRNEIAKPNYYKVTLDDKITTEISPAEGVD